MDDVRILRSVLESRLMSIRVFGSIRAWGNNNQAIDVLPTLNIQLSLVVGDHQRDADFDGKSEQTREYHRHHSIYEDFLKQDQHVIVSTLISMMKKYVQQHDDARVQDCCTCLSYVCGESVRPKMNCVIDLGLPEEQNRDISSIQLVLPDFVQGDVGNRVWAASIVLGKVLGEISLPDIAGTNVLEIGAASGLCGILCATKLKAKHVLLTDFNMACIQAAQESIHLNRCADCCQAMFLDWNWDEPSLLEKCSLSREWMLHSIILGAAIVYEKGHARLVAQFLRKCFDLGSSQALIAIHAEHSDYDAFHPMLLECNLQANRIVPDVRVHETVGTTLISVYRILRLK